MLPILMIVCLAVVEFSFLLIGMQHVQAASAAACRVATLPSDNLYALDLAIDAAAKSALGSENMVNDYQINSQIGDYAGDPVIVQITVPMTAASPNLLKMIGFDLEGRNLVAQTQMSKQ
jgi:Flp pilus assembly protein TadG